MRPATSRAELQRAWLEFFRSRGFVPMTFLTFTFDPQRWRSVSAHKALGLFKWWLHEVNVDLGGRQYKRRCRHSLLSYAVGVDHHKSGDVHLHAVADGWFDYRVARKLWNTRCGFLGVDQVTDGDAALRRMLPYLCKGDDFGPAFWLNRNPVRHPPADRLAAG